MNPTAEHERYRADALFFEEQREELLQQHPEHWIAVYDRRIVGTARELLQLLEQLDRQGLPRGRVFVEFLPAKEDLLILDAE
jgi:Family of unknown function (DUF5678)